MIEKIHKQASETERDRIFYFIGDILCREILRIVSERKCKFKEYLRLSKNEEKVELTLGE